MFHVGFLSRMGLAISCALLVGCGDPAPTPSRQQIVERAVAWLWEKQGEDGGWHSETYGLLRSGQSLTPFVLDALLEQWFPERD